MTEKRTEKEAWTSPTLEVLEMKSTAGGENALLNENEFPENGTPS